jgi:dihydroorotase
LAKKHNTRLHVFHLSTEKEIELFDNTLPLAEKRITAEVCIHHLWFDESKYAEKGTHIKWNPAVKKASDKKALFQALLDDKLDVIATDHAPHTLEEKSNTYFNAPSGGPLVQHALPAMLSFVNQGKISVEKVVEKMCHNPAICFQVKNRGFIREGYFADLVLVDLDKPWKVNKDNILYKCGWSPFEGETFNAQITHTFVNGHIAYEYGSFDETSRGMRLTFDR